MGGERLMSVIGVSEHCVCLNISKWIDCMQIRRETNQSKVAKRPERRNS